MADLLPFPERALKLKDPHFAGYLLGRIRLLVDDGNDPREPIVIEPTRQNHTEGVHRAKVRIAGDATEYELVLRPLPRSAAR
jgi:hypothetical protein